jgi:hypothetical protein
MRAPMKKPIVNVKVDIPLADVKSELGAEFTPRTSTLIARGAGRLEQINPDIIRSRRLYAEPKGRVANIIAIGDYHVIPMRPQNHQCKIIWRDDGTVKTPVNGFQYISEPEEVYLPDDLPDLVPESDDEQSDDEPKPTSLTGDPVQGGDRPEAYEFAVFSKNLG